MANKQWTVAEIVADWLNAHEYDGLYCPDCPGGCFCDMAELGLISCDDERSYNCRPGYKVPCDCGEHAFHIVPEKKDVKQ